MTASTLSPSPQPAADFSSQNAAKASRISRLEIVFCACIAFAFLILKWLDLHAYRIDSDEPQHLHVVWAWANGLLQYRDVFDNHTPLFQMLCAPVFALIPERPDIEIPMRLLMFPLCAATLWVTGKIAARLLGFRAGIYAALLTLAMPGFFFTSEEFRTDDLWMLMWMLCLLFALRTPFTVGAAFRFGLAVGAAFSTSMKSSVLLLSMAIAGAGMLLAQSNREQWPGAKWIAARTATMLAGALMIPTALVLFFAAHGALSSLYYCVITHNLLGHLGKTNHFAGHILRFVVHMGLAFWAARFFLRRFPSFPNARAVTFVFLTAAALWAAMFNLWPVVTAQDYLPLYPLLGILAAVFLCALPGPWRFPIFTATVSLAVALITFIHPPWKDETSGTFQIRTAALRLLAPGEMIMDAKGETVYRPRPFYYVLELLTLKRLSLGLIPDDISERLVATRTCVARTNRLHGRDEAFVEKNYVDIGDKLRVIGRMVSHLAAGQPTGFDLVIPASYQIVSQSGAFSGTIDGQPYHGALSLAAGHHVLVADAAMKSTAIVWSRAIEKGFSPFHRPVVEEISK